MIFPEKPLGYVREALNRMNHDISHIYDDLIFPDHSAYLIEFGKETHELNLYFNAECSADDSEILKEQLISELAGNTGFSLNFNGRFAMEQSAEEQIKLTFSK